jgi:glycosyltransferase involved in cell wall biosynthesis
MNHGMSPLFTVVIPVYNRAHLIGRALGSVLAQTFGDFEIVVIDDGSTDDPRPAVEAVNDPRIRFVRKANGGGGSARNLGIDLARGRYVAFLDSDDEFLPSHLATLRRLLDGTTNTAAYAPMIVNRGNGRSLVKPPRAPHPDEHMATYLMAERGFVPTITLGLETEVARRVRYPEDLRTAEDTDFAIRLYLDGVRFVMGEEPTAIWHDLPDPERQSAGRRGARLIPWLEGLRGRIPARAYYGYRGWAIAKVLASRSRGHALRLYLAAVARGCYRPRLAGIIFLQIFLPDGLYRRIADRAIAGLAAFTGRKPSAA